MIDAYRADGSVESGQDLPVMIRIGPDGTLYFHDLTADLLPVAAALCPQDKALAVRVLAAEQFNQGRRYG